MLKGIFQRTTERDYSQQNMFQSAHKRVIVADCAHSLRGDGALTAEAGPGIE